MSRSPFSPMGKRMRTMLNNRAQVNNSSSSSEDEEGFSRNRSYINRNSTCQNDKSGQNSSSRMNIIETSQGQLVLKEIPKPRKLIPPENCDFYSSENSDFDVPADGSFVPNYCDDKSDAPSYHESESTDDDDDGYSIADSYEIIEIEPGMRATGSSSESSDSNSDWNDGESMLDEYDNHDDLIAHSDSDDSLSFSDDYEDVLEVYDRNRAYAHAREEANPRHEVDYVDSLEDFNDAIGHSPADEYLKHDPTPDGPYPKPEWLTVNELRQRKYGFLSSKLQITPRSNNQLFQRNANNSLWMIQRLAKTKSLEEHSLCVNCLDFNNDGKLICSGSDDRYICIWDWQCNELKKKIPSNHNNTIFDSQFCESDNSIITASRDGSVRLLNVETSQSEQLFKISNSHRYNIGKLAFTSPQTLVSCGNNGGVYLTDLRVKETSKLFAVRDLKNNGLHPLHTINVHPIDKHRIVVAGESPFIFLYDLRRVSNDPNDPEKHKPTHCFDNLDNEYNIITSTAFNSNGNMLLVSYNDDDLIVCRTGDCKIIHRYKGHRNKKTIKGCSWFGDNFVMSGSDDGHIYGWDLNSEHIVCFLKADSRGAINCLNVHPSLPILASSGLDNDVKIWEPIAKTWPQTLKGIKPHICRNMMRRNATKNLYGTNGTNGTNRTIRPIREAVDFDMLL